LLGHAASVAAAALFAAGFVPVKLNLGTAFRNEVVTTIFSKELQKNLYPDNSFYKGCKVDEGVAINAETVEVPQAGAPQR